MYNIFLKVFLVFVFSVIIVFSVSVSENEYGVLPDFSVSAQSSDKGDISDTMSWFFDAPSRTLTITGEGEMPEWTTASDVPWHEYRYHIESVVVEEGVTTAGAFSFYNCFTLTNVSLPESLLTIDRYAFAYSSQLPNIILPSTLTKISMYAFQGCTSLDNIVLPDNVVFVDGFAFAKCSSLKNLKLSSNISFIGTHAFAESAIEELTIPSGLPELGNGALSKCFSLKKLTVSGAETEILHAALSQCTNLEELVVPFIGRSIDSSGTNAVLGYWFSSTDNGGLLVKQTLSTGKYYQAYFPQNLRKVTVTKDTNISASAFADCSFLTEIVLSSGLKTIGEYAFYGCSGIENMYIPDSVTTVGAKAFSFCSSLKELSLSNNITCFDSDAFEGTGTKNVFFYGEIEDWMAIEFVSETKSSPLYGGSNLYINDVLFTAYEIPDGTTDFSLISLAYCHSLTDVTIPKSLTSISVPAFWGCTKIKNVYYRGDISDWCKISFSGGYNSNPMLNAKAFYTNGELLTDLVIPEDVTEIHANQFCGFKADTLIIHKNVKSMNTYAFLKSEFREAVYFNAENYTALASNVFDKAKTANLIIGENVNRIEYNTFYKFSGLKKVTIKSSLSGGVGSEAFYGCTALTAVYYDGNIDDWCSVGFEYNETANPLYYAQNLYIDNALVTDVVIDSTTISSYTFAGYKKLKSVTMTDSVMWIEAGAFYECIGLETIDFSKNVQEIEEYAFYNCSNTKAFEVGQVRYVGQRAFVNCKGLKSIEIVPINSTYIGYYIFQDCTELEKVVLGDNVSEIGWSTFYNCIGLKELTMPGSAEISGAGSAFYNCTNIEKIVLTVGDGTMSNYGSSKSSSTVIYYGYTPWFISKDSLKEIVLPQGVTNIGDYFFVECNVIENLVIPDGVKRIGASAFYNCDNLVSVELPESVTEIGSSAFGACDKLDYVPIPNGLTHVSTYMFSGDDSIKKIVLPQSVESIAVYAFNNCPNLEEIVIPAATVTIADKAIWGCNSLVKITVAEENSAYCSDSYGALYNKDKTQLIFYPSGNPTIEYTVPDTVTEIKANAFGNCANLNSITLGKLIKTIPTNTFAGCTGLIDVYYNGTLADWCSITFGNEYANPMSVAENLYINNKLVTELDLHLPDAVPTTVNAYAFYGCECVENIIIPVTLQEIGIYAFYGCTGVETLTLSEGITEIGEGAFYNLSSLTTVNYNCTSFYTNNTPVFKGCDKLTTVNFGSGVVKIAKYAFADCTGITKIAVPKSVTTIGPYAFSGCTNLTGVKLEKGLKNIYDHAFLNCSSLKNFEIPESVTIIGESAFYNCSSLENIKLPEGMLSIKRYAFAYCTGLTVIDIPLQVKTISDGAFKNCSNIVEIYMPLSVTTIGNYAFDNCIKLKDVYYEGSAANWAGISKGSYNSYLLNANIHYDYHVHSFVATVLREANATQSCIIRRYCITCGLEEREAVAGTGFDVKSTAELDLDYKIIYGLSAGLTSLDEYTRVAVDDFAWAYTPTKNGFGTGTKAVLETEGGSTLGNEYTIVIFGDVNGDGWYDGEDAFIVNLIVKGILDECDIGYALWSAADCNHDGVIDEADVELLNRAGLLLNEVRQTTTEVEVEETAVYIEYMGMINQSFDSVDDIQTPENNEDTAEETDSVITRLVEFFRRIFEYMFSLIIS